MQMVVMQQIHIVFESNDFAAHIPVLFTYAESTNIDTLRS